MNHQPSATVAQYRYANLTYGEQCSLEVEWYREHGRYPGRVLRDECGRDFVLSDKFWNHNHRLCVECVDRAIADFVYEQKTGIAK